jgi:hypothetical protein
MASVAERYMAVKAAAHREAAEVGDEYVVKHRLHAYLNNI